MDTWHHLRGLPEAFSPKKYGKIQFRMSSNNFAQWKMHQHQFRLSGAFCITVQNFRMVMRNQFLVFSLSYNQIFFWSISHDCANFPHVHAKWKNTVFQLFFCHFFHFFLLILLQLPPNQLQIPIQIDCIASFIMHLDHHQLYLFSSI